MLPMILLPAFRRLVFQRDAKLPRCDAGVEEYCEAERELKIVYSLARQRLSFPVGNPFYAKARPVISLDG
jgi:hypothetical protein